MFCVYVLESINTEKLYIGTTRDLKRRITEHNHKENSSTKPYAPWRCIYCELCLNEADARRREKYLKTSQGHRLLRRRLKEYFYEKRRRAS